MAWLSAEMIKIQEATMIDILGTRVHDLYKGKCNKNGEHDGAIVFLTLAEWLSGWGENLRHCALNQKNMCKHVGSIVGDGSCLLHFAERLRVWQRTVASVFNGVSRSARAPV